MVGGADVPGSGSGGVLGESTDEATVVDTVVWVTVEDLTEFDGVETAGMNVKDEFIWGNEDLEKSGTCEPVDIVGVGTGASSEIRESGKGWPLFGFRMEWHSFL